ncbi:MULTISPECIES: N-acetylmuramoyl-L-alanine amidase family protein [Flavobacterium]|uniref:N-acetylmuramoyl-L-alanine amidase n=2 Tax=Flavobacterium TaxID=237 RepID=A0A940X841_9FLAO|nr:MULTISPECIES: N-acetylmuramoyl-L-alanine amidase [Flavobacterium]MBP4136866.1 N-acetylmuramoyl-L-alanine amidase [Flavobacterium geliluteum]MDX6182669.1 N-acetylmuramoyl-L-alanine amidase [Flavobacterium sp. Fl-33]MDX6186151.1 N-acetylmuramoyl-L-alanine amidase [Flavobacterium sp. Fl-77]UFH38299.1 N-acetylmuramoyl-L-alanine amidase [Flavobacterium sp. F-70]
MNIFNRTRLIFSFFLTITSICAFSQANVFKVTLDAGHGDHDFGAVYSGRIEKNIALAIVLKVGKILELNPNVDVIYTRKTDVFVDLVERANIANRSNSNIFVSIHCNANKNTNAFGTETYVMGLSKSASNLEVAKNENSVITLEKDYKQKYDGYDPKSPESMIGMNLLQEEYLDNSISLASKVEENFEKLGKVLRQGGVKQAGFMVLHKAYMPRVLIETGFISNPTEGDILNSEEGQNDIAKAIAEAILSYKREYFGTGAPEMMEARPKKDTSIPVKPKAVETPVIKNAPKGTFFKVQLIASIKKTPLEPKNFKGLKNVTMVFENNIYKYFYQETSDYQMAQKYLQEAKSKGYGASFLIAYKDGEKISIQDAIK